MRRLLMLQTALFSTFVLVLAVLATGRAVPFHPPAHSDTLRGQTVKSFETHYDEVFPARTLGVNVWAAIDYLLFHEGRPGVVVGRDGWLYTDEEFKLGDGYDSAIRDNLALIGWVRQQLALRQAGLVLAVVPAKTRVYPEFLDSRQPPPAQRELYARIENELSRRHIADARLLQPLLEAKAAQPMFLRTDTHWTPAGARLAAQRIAGVVNGAGLGNSAGTAFVTRPDHVETHRGDLLGFLPLDPYFAALLPPADSLAVTRTEPAEAGGGDLLGDAPAPRVVLVGTSYSANPRWNFAGALKQVLREDVASYAREGVGPFRPMLDYLRSEDFRRAPPRLVVWEVPERYVAQAQDLAAYPEAAAVVAAAGPPRTAPR